MGTVAVPRLKREDCKRTKHGSHFSKWQVLIGASDWEDHALGKEGAERYRLFNLPKISCPGVYELAVYVSPTSLGRGVRKLDSDRIIVIYVGQADSVRTRLQHYGRSGAHLGNGCSTAHPNDSEPVLLPKGPGLFEEMFLRGHSILYRWAPMKNKRDAEKTEAELLKTFDYAWNKGSNGARRRNDILQKLDTVASITSQFSSIAAKLYPFSPKQVGIKINSSKLPSLENKNSTYVDEENKSLLWGAIKFSRSRPRLVSVSDTSGGSENNTSICGVALGDGSVCRKAPVQGRKRCAGHKGMKLNGSIAKLINEGKSHLGVESFESSISDSSQSDNDVAHNYGYDPPKLPLIAGNYPVGEDFTFICGITLNDGSACRRQPVQGRKRCIEHEGRRIIKPNSESIERKSVSQHDVVLGSSSPDSLAYKRSSEICKLGEEQARVSSERSVIDKHYDLICGVDIGYGIFCTRQPVRGRVRCEEHKGMKVDVLNTEDKSHSKCSTYSDWRYGNTFVCGATTIDGSLCRRQPVKGNKRCWQHKGMRADSSFSFLSFETHKTMVTCGVALWNGSVCMKAPVPGRKRCEQHKGMRV